MLSSVDLFVLGLFGFNRSKSQDKILKRTKMQVKINVFLKDGVLDPAGKAVRHALTSLNFKGIEDVRIGKQIIIDFTQTPSKAELKKMCDELLANPVIEDYEILENGDE